MKTIFILLLSLMSLGKNVIAAESCQALYQNLQHQLEQQQLESVAPLLLQMESVCSQTELDQAKTGYSNALAKQANNKLNNNELNEAEALLNKTQIQSWTIVAVRADIAVKRKQWLEASQLYGQAYDLLGDIKTDNSAQKTENQRLRKQLAELAADAQLVYGKIDPGKTRDGFSQGIRLTTRDIGVQQTVLPVHFQSNKASLDTDGQASATQMAQFIKTQSGISKVLITGFADPRGSSEHNQLLSEQRAQAVAEFLKNNGVTTSIETLGKGETAPSQTNLQGLTEEEQLQRWRRVEMVIQ